MNNLIWLVSIALPIAPAIVLAVVLSGTFAKMGVPSPLNWIIAGFVSLMFEMTGAVAGKAYQNRIRREGAANSGLLFVLIYVVAVIAVVVNADGEITSRLLAGMLIAFPVVSVATYVNLAALEQVKSADGIDAARTAMQLEFERREKELELQQQIEAAEFERREKAKDAETRRTIKMHKTAQPIAQSMHNTNAQPDNISDAIIAQLQAGSLNQSALAAEFGVHRNTIGNQLHKLDAQGIVHKNGGGWALSGSHND
uniref:Uncharacterized protein n=1 Tax=viral metagenome TaxID=1070528 RepID=A0A6M3L578_9ZZZZ